MLVPEKNRGINNIKLRTKLMLLAVVCAISLVVSGLLSVVSVVKINEANNKITGELIPLLVIAEELDTLTSDFRLKEFSHLVSYNSTLMEQRSREMEVIDSQIKTQFAKYYKITTDEQEIELMDQVYYDWKSYQQHHDTIIMYSEQNEIENARIVLMDQAKPKFDKVAQGLVEIVKYDQEKADHATEVAENLAQDLFTYLIICIVAFTVLVSGFTFYIIYSFDKSLNKIKAIINKVTAGDFGQAINYEGKDEIREIGDSIDLLLDRFNNIISDEMNYLYNLGQENFTVESMAPDAYVGDLKPIYTSMEQLRQRLKEAKEAEYKMFLFEVLAERIDNVFIIYDRSKNRCEYVFSNIERVLGVSKESAYENPLCILDMCEENEISAAIREGFDNEYLHVFMQTELEYINPQTNETRWLKLSVSPVENNGLVTRYILGYEDLTETQRVQRTLKDALINAQNYSKARNNFFSNVSHEIRTPLNAIIGMTTIAATCIDNPAKIEDCLAKTMLSAKHLLMLINDVLDISKIENGRLSIENQAFRLEELIDEINDIVYLQSELNNQEFKVIIHPNTPCNLIGDKFRLKQVLLNLLTNSLKFTETGGHITLEIKDTMKRFHNIKYLQFIVTDDGCGMSADFQKIIFLPFEQEHRIGLNAAKGTGLGMAIVKNLVDLMSGTMSLESELDRGTKFTIELPFSLEEEQSNNYMDRSLEQIHALVVDDSKEDCEHTSILLEQMGVNAEWVLSGSEALERIRQTHLTENHYDVAIVDLRMPEMDGIELTRRIRKTVGPNAIIIIISAYDWKSIEFEARQAGANAFISKPMFQSSLYNLLVSAMKGYVDISHHEQVDNYHFEGKRILLVEDNPLNMEIAETLLSATGLTIETAVDGEIAVHRFMEMPVDYYDAILMDVQMPNMNGYEATRAIRKSERTDSKTVPIIAMTANAFAEDALAAMDAGMNAHIAKPINTQILFDTLRESFS